MDCITGMMWNKICLEPPISPLSGVSRYLMPLWVSKLDDPQDGPCKSDSSQSIITPTGFEPRTVNLFSYRQVSIMYKIRAALKCLTFREQHVLVQFWSPREVGKHHLLTTNDQPFGVGVPTEELCFYRRDSEHQVYLVDKDHEEEDISPIARVFRRGLPEWTSDLTNYNPKDFSQLACAMCCDLHGYLALPVFDSATSLCVGVLELLTSSKFENFAYEVEHIHRELKKWNLTSPLPFDVFNGPDSNVFNERRKNELDKIFGILKVVCDTHNLPLGQTWTVSPSSSYFAHEKVIVKSCCSFNTRCFQKVCMSTTGLPFYARDLNTWSFMEAIKECHLEKSRGVAGRAMSSRGSCFCEDVTKLDEEEYPLVHNARMSGLTSCFAIFLHSVECDDDDDGDYVLEFFLKDSRDVFNLVQTLKQGIGFAFGFEFGEMSILEVKSEPRIDVSQLSLSMNPQTVQISPTTTAINSMDSSDSESVLANVAKTETESAIVSTQWSPTENQPTASTNAGIYNNQLKRTRKRKRKTDSLTMVSLKPHLGKSLDQTAHIFGVSRSTMKRFCRKQGISSWPPLPKQIKRNGFVFNSKLIPKLFSEKYLQRSSIPSFGSSISSVVCVLIRVKRWSCSSKKHGFLGKWWSCGKHSYLPFHGYSKSLSRDVDHSSDTRSLVVKVSFNDDMVRFLFPLSGGFSKLKNEVVRRFDKVKGRRFNLKYEDEDEDMVLVSCDEDLEIMANNTTIKLVVEAND